MAVTIAGANADLIEPISWAHRMVGGTTASIIVATDAELATIAVADYDKFLDAAEYRSLANIIGHLRKVDIAVGPESRKLSQLIGYAENRMKALWDLIGPAIVAATSPPTMSYWSLDFLEHGD